MSRHPVANRGAVLALAVALTAVPAGAQVFGRFVEKVIPVTAIPVGSSTEDGPVLAAVDGNESTAWKAAAGTTTASGIIVLPEARTIAGLVVRGRLGAGSLLTVAWLAADGPISFFGGTAAGPFDGEVVLDLSLERAVTDRLVVTLSGPHVTEDAVSEVEVLAFDASPAVRRLAPDDVTTGGDAAERDAAEWLCDGDVRTAWRNEGGEAFAAFTSQAGIPDAETDILRRAARTAAHLLPVAEREADGRWTPGRLVAGEAVLSYDEPVDLRSIKVYFSEAPRGGLSVASWSGSAWRVLASASGAPRGWTTLELGEEVEGRRFRISLSHPGEDARRITEVEFWGSRADPPPDIVPGERIETGTPDDLLVRFLPDRPGDYALELSTGGPARSKIAGTLNGDGITLVLVGTLGSRNLYRARIVSKGAGDERWLAVRGAADLGIVESRLRLPERSGEWAVPGAGVLGDGSLVTPMALEGETRWELDRTLAVLAVDVRGPAAGSAAVSVRSGGRWLALSSSCSSPGCTTFACDHEVDAVELRAAGGIAEVNLLGSPTADAPLEIRVIEPEADVAPRHAVLLGTVSDPSVTVSVNEVKPRRIGPFFLVGLDVVDPSARDRYHVVIHAVDGEGRTAVEERSWLRTGLAPLTVDQAGDLHATTEAGFEVSGRTVEQIYAVEVNGAAVPLAANRFATRVPVTTGFNTIVITARRRSTGAVEAARLVRVVRHGAGFTVEVTSPVAASVVPTSHVVITGRLIAAVMPATVTVGGVAARVEGDRFSTVAPLALLEGSNEVTVTAHDAAGRTAAATVRIVVDTVAPTIAFVRPAAGSFVGTSTVTLEARASDASPVVVSIDGTIVAPVGDRCVLTMVIPDGTRTVRAVAVDAAGNRSYAECSFVVDATPPEPFVAMVDPPGWTGDPTPVVRFATRDATSGVARYEVRVDSGPPVTATSPFTLGPLADGEHAVEVTAFDLAGNRCSADTGAFVDTVAPPAPVAFRGIEGPDRVILAWEAPADDVESYRVERTPAWDGGPRSTAGIGLVDDGLPAGSAYSYRIVAIDRAGHESPPASDASMVGIAVAPVVPGEPGGMVEFDKVELFYPTEALPEGVAQVQITTATSPRLEEAAVFGLAGPIYDFTVGVEGPDGLHRQEGVEFSREFIGTIQYDPSLVPEGFPEENLGLFFWDTMWSQWVRVETCAVDVDRNTILFATSHFTLFSVQPTLIQDLSPQELADVGYSPFKAQVTQGGVTVSTQGGSAMTGVTEFVLPGKAGFDFVLRRTWDTATARGDSPSAAVNLALSFSLRSLAESTGDILRLADANALVALLDGVGGSVLSQLRAKIDGIFRNCGDYAYSMGIGWRLDLPYIRSAGGRVLVRTPSGAFHPVNYMSLASESNILNFRTLVLENHEGEDFTLVVRQICLPVDITTLTTGGGGLTLPVLSWIMTDAELVMKDGSTWYFDALGRVTRLVDGTGQNRVEFQYGGHLGYFLESITDSMGRVLRFDYERGGPLDIVPRISSITLEGDPQGRRVGYTYTECTLSGLRVPGAALLASATDAVGRTWTYGYDGTLMLEGNVAVKLNLLGLLIDLVPGARLFLRNTVPPSLTISGRLSTEFACTLASIEGPGAGYVRIATEKRTCIGADLEFADYLFGFIPTAVVGSLEFPAQLFTSSVKEYAHQGGANLKTTTYAYSFRYAGHHQVVNDETLVADGRTLTTHHYSTTKKERHTFITKIDLLTSMPLFGEAFWFQEIIPYETSFTVTTLAADAIESTELTYDLGTMRMLSRTVTRGEGHSAVTSWTYDTWGNVEELAETTNDGDAVTARTTRTSWYVNRRLGAHENTLPAGSPYLLPELSRPRMDLPLGVHVTYGIPAAAGGSTTGSQDTWYRYDSLGQMIAETVAVGAEQLETRYGYDDAGELVRTVSPAGTGESLVTNIEREYSIGRYYLVRTTRADVDLSEGVAADLETVVWFDTYSGLKVFERDARGYLSAWSYDAVGRPTVVIEPEDGDPRFADPLLGTSFMLDNPTTRIVYDDSVFTATVTGARGQVTVYDFDQAGRLERIVRIVRRLDEDGQPLAGGEQVQETLVGYDGWGNITSIVDPNGHRTEYGYDAGGRLSSVQYPEEGGSRPRRTMAFDYRTNLQTTVDERGYVTLDRFDMADRPLGTTAYPDEPGGKGRAVTTSIAYDGMGRESVVVDELGGVTVKRYDERGRIREIVSPAATFFEGGVERTYAPRKVMSYDDAGALLSESEVTAVAEFVTRYANNQVGLPLVVEQPYTDRTGGTPVESVAREYYGYDAAGNRVSTIDANDAGRLPAEQKPRTAVYSARGKVLAETDRAGNLTSYAYDADDNVVAVTDPRGNDPAYRGTFTARFRYDDANRLVLAIVPAASGGDETARIELAYDPRGNLVTRRDPDGMITSIVYSARNKPVVERRHDAADLVSVLTARSYDQAALEIETVVGGMYRTTFAYDGAGRLVRTTRASGSSEKLGYDAAGNVNRIEDGNGHATTSSFDSHHRLLVETDPAGAARRLSYDARGNLTREIDANGNARFMAYDELGRLIREERADGASYEWVHDPVGNLVRSRDPAGIVSEYEYTDDYRVARVRRSDGTREQVQEFTWDRAGNRLRASSDSVTLLYNTSTEGHLSDPYGRVRNLEVSIAGETLGASWDYDEAGRLTRLGYPGGRSQAWGYDGIGQLDDVEGWIVSGSMQRDSAGRLLGYSLANGVTVEQAWSPDGLLAELAYGGAAGELLPSYDFTYDRAGDLVAKGSCSYRYDVVRRLVYADEIDRTPVQRSVAAGAVLEDYQGQAELVFGAPDLEIKLDRGATSVGADLGGVRDLIGLTLHPDAAGHRVRSRNIEIWAGTGGRFERVDNFQATVASDGSLVVTFAGTVIATAIKVHCRYDERDRYDQVVDLAQFKNQASKLLTVTHRQRRQVQEYGYDAKGNRTELTRTRSDGAESTMEHCPIAYWPSSDRVKTFGEWTYVYDAKGRLVEKGTEYLAGMGFAAESGTYVRYSWDLFDRLEAVWRSDAGVQGAVEAVRYGYDPDGMRVLRVAGAVVTRWVYGPDGNPILETSGGCEREFVYAEGKLLGYRETLGGTTRQYYTLTDQVGSVVSTTDDRGVEFIRRDYLAFGAEAGTEGTLAAPALYTGKEWDPEAELYYFNARWYDPEMGRFISEDPIMDGENWYAYCGNSPLTHTDPTGLFDPDDPTPGKRPRSAPVVPPSLAPVPLVSRDVAGIGATNRVPITVMRGENLLGRAYGHFGDGYTAIIPPGATSVDCTQFTAFASGKPVVGSSGYPESAYYDRVAEAQPGDTEVWRATSPEGVREGHGAIFTGFGGSRAILHAFGPEDSVVYSSEDVVQSAYESAGYSDITIEYYRPRQERNEKPSSEDSSDHLRFSTFDAHLISVPWKKKRD